MFKKSLYLLIFVLILSVLVSCEIANNNPTDTVTGQTETEPDSTHEAHIHQYADWLIVQDATCTVQGSKVRYCDCGEKQTEIIQPAGHTVIREEAVAATVSNGIVDGAKAVWDFISFWD